MYVSPIGAFGAIAFTIGKYGVVSLASYGQLLLTYYLTGLIFVFVVLGIVCRLAGFSLIAFLGFIREELADRAWDVIVGVGFAATDGKARAAWMRKSVVGLVVPAGYSF